MVHPLSPKTGKDIKVLLLDPLPLHSENKFTTANFHIDECFENCSEAELVKRIGDYQIVCLR